MKLPATLALILLSAAVGCGPRAFESYAIAVGKVVVEGSDPPEPVEGADVVLAGVQFKRIVDDDTGKNELLTGTEADGSFLIRDIPLIRLDVFITVSKDAYRTFDRDLNLQSGGDLVIQLTPVDDELQAGTINGRATNVETGEPLSQVEVRATVENAGVVVDEQKAHTSNEGKFQISGIPVGEVILSASVEGFIPAHLPVFVLPGQGSNRFVDLELAPGTLRVTLQGRVFDIESQLPLAGALIGTDESTDTAMSAEDGTFLLPNVLVGERVVSAMLQGYDPLFVTMLVLAENEPIALGMAPASGNPPPPVYNIGGVISVTGVEDASGVSVVLIAESDNTVVGRITTEADGFYGFFVWAGTYTVQASLPGYSPAQVLVSLLPGQIRDDIDLTLVP